MDLPFSHDAFLDLFGSYNARFWPVVLALWIATAAVAVQWVAGQAAPGQHAWHPALARLHALDRWSGPPPRGHRLAAAVLFVALTLVLLPPGAAS